MKIPSLKRIMRGLRVVLPLVIVFLGTMGVYFYYRLNYVLERQFNQEFGNRETPGFDEAFQADALLMDPLQPPAQGNNRLAEEVADTFRTQAGDAAAAYVPPPTEDALEDGPEALATPRVYCLLRAERNYLFLLTYLPGLDEVAREDQVNLAARLWPRAQALARARLPGYPTVGLALAGPRLYGPILVGGREGRWLYHRVGGRQVLYPYFDDEPSLQPSEPALDVAREERDR